MTSGEPICRPNTFDLISVEAYNQFEEDCISTNEELLEEMRNRLQQFPEIAKLLHCEKDAKERIEKQSAENQYKFRSHTYQGFIEEKPKRRETKESPAKKEQNQPKSNPAPPPLQENNQMTEKAQQTNEELDGGDKSKEKLFLRMNRSLKATGAEGRQQYAKFFGYSMTSSETSVVPRIVPFFEEGKVKAKRKRGSRSESFLIVFLMFLLAYLVHSVQIFDDLLRGLI